MCGAWCVCVCVCRCRCVCVCVGVCLPGQCCIHYNIHHIRPILGMLWYACLRGYQQTRTIDKPVCIRAAKTRNRHVHNTHSTAAAGVKTCLQQLESCYWHNYHYRQVENKRWSSLLASVRNNTHSTAAAGMQTYLLLSLYTCTSDTIQLMHKHWPRA